MNETTTPAVVALVSFFNVFYREEWQKLAVDRIERNGNRYFARILPGQDVPITTPGDTHAWGRILKGDNKHLTFPDLKDGESAPLTEDNLKPTRSKKRSA